MGRRLKSPSSPFLPYFKDFLDWYGRWNLWYDDERNEAGSFDSRKNVLKRAELQRKLLMVPANEDYVEGADTS
jgi:hypothetical protein